MLDEKKQNRKKTLNIRTKQQIWWQKVMCTITTNIIHMCLYYNLQYHVKKGTH